MDWLIISLLAVLFWGFWGFLSKLALEYMTWQHLIILTGFGISVATLSIYFYFRPNLPEISRKGIVFGTLVGIVYTIGTLCFSLALSRGKASIVVPLTSLYPLITMLLAFLLLKERITILQGIGIIFSLIAMLLMSL